MKEKHILINKSNSVLLYSLKRYFYFIFGKAYKISPIRTDNLEDVFCYFFIQDGKINLSDQICKIRNYEYNKAKENNSEKIFKPIFVLKYLEDEFTLDQQPFYNIITVQQLHKIGKIKNLNDNDLIKKDYQAILSIKSICGGYVSKIRHDIKALPPKERKRKLEGLKDRLPATVLKELKKEINL